MSFKFPLKSAHPFVYTGIMYCLLVGISDLLIYFINPNLFWDLIVYLFVFATIVVVSVLISYYGPSQNHYRRSDWQKPENQFHPPIDADKWNIVLDTHCHTKAREGSLNVEQVITYHQAMGFNACVITEHNTMSSILSVLRARRKFKNKFIVIPGLEYTTSRIHMCFIGIRSWKGSIPFTPTNVEIREAIEQVHRKGGVVAVCHYPWSTGGPTPKMPDHPTREQMLEWGVDLIEVANWDDEINHYDPISLEFTKTHPKIGPCVGTDLHFPERARICGWTVLKTRKFTPNAVMEELRRHHTDVVLLPSSLPYPIYHEFNYWYQIFRPFIMIGLSFQTLYYGGKISNFDSTAAVVWLIYVLSGFWIYQLIAYLIGLI